MSDFYRVCLKIYAPEPAGIGDDASVFVPIFHEWIRNSVLDLVLLDVADYAHTPDSPGIMLVAHEVSFALDRSDGRFGLLAQRRTPFAGDAVDAVERTLRQAIQVAARLEADPSLAGKLKFNASAIQIESNDRLSIPNTDGGFRDFEPIVRDAVGRVYVGRPVSISKVENDPRDRLALDVRIESAADVQEYMAA